MKKFAKTLAFFLLLTSILIPLLPTITTAQEEEPIIYRMAASALPGDWDPAISDGYNLIYGYFVGTAEYICSGNANYWAGLKGKVKEEEFKQILCTSWETVWRPEEENTLGFNNTGGRSSTTFTLREGVKFHDGSDWNATVMKWNIDRMYLITGNLTGNGDMRNMGNRWNDVDDYLPYTAEHFNVTEFDQPSLDTAPLPGDEPGPEDYSWYDIGNATYPGVTAVNGIVRNPHPYGGWDYEADTAIHYAPYDKFPQVRRIEIVEDKKSGGKVKCIYNTFQSYGMEGIWERCMSYDEYHTNYTDRGIFGYENGVKDPKNPTIVDHMIGTGPYKFVVHDETASPAGGYMVKFEDYWNKTALEAEGWFDVDRLEVVNFPTGQLGKDAQNTAILTHAVDYAYDSMYMPVDYDAVMANPNIDYIEDYPSEYMTRITLNCINETWWLYLEGWRRNYYSDTERMAGIPLALRAAINYAFDYDKMIHTVLDDRAVRGGGIVSEASVFYNASVPLPQCLKPVLQPPAIIPSDP